jgi:hypothetical protein
MVDVFPVRLFTSEGFCEETRKIILTPGGRFFVGRPEYFFNLPLEIFEVDEYNCLHRGGNENPSGLAAGWGDHTSSIFKDLGCQGCG